MSKLAKATDIVKAKLASNVAKKEILEVLVAELGISRSNAFVYFTKATKGVSVPKAPKGEKVSKEVNAVTGLTKEKATKKLSDIDKFIASVKAEQKAASPFAQLGA